MNAGQSEIRTVGDLSDREFASALETGLPLQIGPFTANIVSSVDSLVTPLRALYRDYALLPQDGLFSFHASLQPCRRFPRVDRKMVRFSVDGVAPHEDMPAEQALPVLEWGINLVIALRSHCFLMLHSAVVARNGRAMLLPAAPGHGKTTLCSGLALRGWRLLSDEFGLVRPGTTDMVSVPRPMALKNESIDVIRQFDPAAHIGPTTPGTRKGDVAHLRPPGSSVQEAGKTATASWIVFPRWVPDSECRLTELPKTEGFMLIASNAFNYELLGEAGFETVAGLIDTTRCFEFVYSDLNVAVDALTDFTSRDDV